MIKVKVCGMYDPLNVRKVVEAKPDFVGFIFYPESPRYVGDDPVMESFHNVPPYIKRVGVFYNEDNHKILELSMRKGLDMVQLHGEESPISCLQLKYAGLTVIKAFSIGKDFDFGSLMQYAPVCDFFLFDTKSDLAGGSGKKFNWQKLDEYSIDKPFFLSGGIGPEDAEELKSINIRGFYAVDINSRFETSPGIKDVSMIKSFIEKIKIDRK